MRNRMLILIILLFTILYSVSLGCLCQTTQLVAIGGQLGGTSERTCTAISEVVHKTFPEIVVDVRPGSGLSNIMNISQKNADIGIAVNTACRSSVLGIEPFDTKLSGVTAIASTTPAVSHWITLEQTGINSIQQIIDEKIPVRISVGDVASNTELGFRRYLNTYGITYDDIQSWGGKVYLKQAVEASDMMASGQLDVQFCDGTIPLSFILELSVTHDLKLLPMDASNVEMMADKFGYSKHYITNKVYDFVETDSLCYASVSNIIVREDLPEDIVYKITKAIGDNLEYFHNMDKAWEVVSIESMAQQNPGVELHPGAIRYYKEIGVLE